MVRVRDWLVGLQVSRRATRFQRGVLRDDRRRGPPRRHHSLPREQGVRARCRPRVAHPVRQRRPVRLRHHRRDPHAPPRDPDRSPEGRVHARAAGPHRPDHRRVPPGYQRVRPRRVRAQAPMGGWAGLQARHRSRRGRRAQRARGPAEHLAPLRQHDGPRPRDDPLERTWVLRGRRVRDQDREPAGGEGGEDVAQFRR